MSVLPPKRQALGRGLGALIPTRVESAPSLAKGNVRLAIDEVRPNKTQPRKSFDDAALEELAASIKEHGLMQPILVRAVVGGAYEIIAGERRWRACQRAGLQHVDVIVKDLADDHAFEWALIENIQREDLNPIEEAEAYQRLLDLGSLTQEQLALRVGKDRSTVANALRLLRLPDEVRRQVIAGAISMGHARALLGLETSDQMVKMAKDVLRHGYSVRELEKKIRTLRSAQPSSESASEYDAYAAIPGGKKAVDQVTAELTRKLGTRLRIVPNGPKGRLEIDYSTPDELERVVAFLRSGGN